MNRPSAHLATCLILLASGCVTAQAKRTDALRQSLDAFTYDKPLDEVWQDVRLLLAQEGYGLAGKDASAVGQDAPFLGGLMSPAHETTNTPYNQGLLQKHTRDPDVQWLDTGWDRNRERYHVEGRRVGDGCKITFFKIIADLSPDGFGTSARDVEMELNLARRVAPTKADEIEASAESAE
jgi:hypothetical protein